MVVLTPLGHYERGDTRKALKTVSVTYSKDSHVLAPQGRRVLEAEGTALAEKGK